ncbi:MAG: alpha/beta hydrolase [Ancrocorticia sp.]
MSYLNIEGVLVHAEDAGDVRDGEPILLLHGGFNSLEHLRPLGEILARTHRVLSFERPGHGRSPDIAGDYSYDQGVAQALAFLDTRGVGSAHIIGYSDGAIIGLLLALRHPGRVRSLVSISGNLNPGAFNDSADDGASQVLLPLPEISEESEPEANDTDTEREHYERLSPDGPHHADVVLNKLFTLWTSEPQIEPSELKDIAAPTLIMSADRDTIRPDHSLLMAASIPGAQLCIVPGATHDLVADRPALVNLVVTEFLRDGYRTTTKSRNLS